MKADHYIAKKNLPDFGRFFEQKTVTTDKLYLLLVITFFTFCFSSF